MAHWEWKMQVDEDWIEYIEKGPINCTDYSPTSADVLVSDLQRKSYSNDIGEKDHGPSVRESGQQNSSSIISDTRPDFEDLLVGGAIICTDSSPASADVVLSDLQRESYSNDVGKTDHGPVVPESRQRNSSSIISETGQDVEDLLVGGRIAGGTTTHTCTDESEARNRFNKDHNSDDNPEENNCTIDGCQFSHVSSQHVEPQGKDKDVSPKAFTEEPAGYIRREVCFCSKYEQFVNFYTSSANIEDKVSTNNVNDTLLRCCDHTNLRDKLTKSQMKKKEMRKKTETVHQDIMMTLFPENNDILKVIFSDAEMVNRPIARNAQKCDGNRFTSDIYGELRDMSFKDVKFGYYLVVLTLLHSFYTSQSDFFDLINKLIDINDFSTIILFVITQLEEQITFLFSSFDEKSVDNHKFMSLIKLLLKNDFKDRTIGVFAMNMPFEMSVSIPFQSINYCQLFTDILAHPELKTQILRINYGEMRDDVVQSHHTLFESFSKFKGNVYTFFVAKFYQSICSNQVSTFLNPLTKLTSSGTHVSVEIEAWPFDEKVKGKRKRLDESAGWDVRNQLVATLEILASANTVQSISLKYSDSSFITDVIIYLKDHKTLNKLLLTMNENDPTKVNNFDEHCAERLELIATAFNNQSWSLESFILDGENFTIQCAASKLGGKAKSVTSEKVAIGSVELRHIAVCNERCLIDSMESHFVKALNLDTCQLKCEGLLSLLEKLKMIPIERVSLTDSMTSIHMTINQFQEFIDACASISTLKRLHLRRWRFPDSSVLLDNWCKLLGKENLEDINIESCISKNDSSTSKNVHVIVKAISLLPTHKSLRISLWNNTLSFGDVSTLAESNRIANDGEHIFGQFYGCRISRRSKIVFDEKGCEAVELEVEDT